MYFCIEQVSQGEHLYDCLYLMTEIKMIKKTWLFSLYFNFLAGLEKKITQQIFTDAKYSRKKEMKKREKVMVIGRVCSFAAVVCQQILVLWWVGWYPHEITFRM